MKVLLNGYFSNELLSNILSNSFKFTRFVYNRTIFKLNIPITDTFIQMQLLEDL